jgi:hypothetical protein
MALVRLWKPQVEHVLTAQILGFPQYVGTFMLLYEGKSTTRVVSCYYSAFCCHFHFLVEFSLSGLLFHCLGVKATSRPECRV